MMDKYITDERTGLKYELVGDYYLIAGDDEAYVVPVSNNYSIDAVNSKITGYSSKPSAANSLWYNVGIAK